MTRFVAVAGVLLLAAGCAAGTEPAARDACDPANRTQAVLDHAASTFHLALPGDASDVRFATNEGGSAYALTVVFRTTRDGPAAFAAASGFPVPAAPGGQIGQPLSAGTPLCGLGNGFAYSAVVRENSAYPGQLRSLAIDETDADAPQVLVVAAVL